MTAEGMVAQLDRAGTQVAGALILENQVIGALLRVLVDRGLVSQAEIDAALVVATTPAEKST